MTSSDPQIPQGNGLAELAEQFAKSAVEGEESDCSELLGQALTNSDSIVEIYQEFLGRAMAYVGEWYHVGAIDEGGEHLASEITERAMLLTAQHFGLKARNGLTVLLGGGPESWHVIGLRMLGDVLRHRGWKTMYLGPNVPVASFLKAVGLKKPDLVLMSCNAVRSMDGTLELLRALRSYREANAATESFLIGVGGTLVSAHPERFSEAGADFTARDLKSFIGAAVPEIERVATSRVRWSEAHFPAFATMAHGA